MNPEALARFKNACFESIAYAETGNPEKAAHWLGLAQAELQKLTHEKALAANQG